MDNLILAKTKSTLGVNFNASSGECVLEGSSFPENTSDFFKPVTDWLIKYMLEVTGKVTLNLKFDYLNSSSIKFISDIADRLQSYHNAGAEVELKWYYDENDEDILEMGQELKEDINFPFNLIMK